MKILIADDHKIFRQGLKSLLEHDNRNFEIDEVGSEQAVISMVDKKDYDLFILDIDLGSSNGIEITDKLISRNPKSNILILSMFSQPEFVVQSIDAGAKGYILKNDGKDELLSAIKTVSNGNSYFSNEISSNLRGYIKNQKIIDNNKSKIPLSKREIEILKLIYSELSNKEIAEMLFISTRTVDTHRRNLLEKLNIKNNVGLVKYVINNKLIDES